MFCRRRLSYDCPWRSFGTHGRPLVVHNIVLQSWVLTFNDWYKFLKNTWVKSYYPSRRTCKTPTIHVLHLKGRDTGNLMFDDEQQLQPYFQIKPFLLWQKEGLRTLKLYGLWSPESRVTFSCSYRRPPRGIGKVLWVNGRERSRLRKYLILALFYKDVKVSKIRDTISLRLRLWSYTFDQYKYPFEGPIDHVRLHLGEQSL